MDKLKMIFQQTLMISTGILFVAGIEGVVSHLMGKSFALEWYAPFSMILTGFLCSLPTWLLILKEDSVKKRFIWNLILHCLALWAIVSIMGWIFRWYSRLGEYLFVAIGYFAVYVFVWVATIWLQRSEDNQINEALKNIQDEE